MQINKTQVSPPPVPNAQPGVPASGRSEPYPLFLCGCCALRPVVALELAPGQPAERPQLPIPQRGGHVSVSLGNAPPRRLLATKGVPHPALTAPLPGGNPFPARRCCCEERRALVVVRAHKGRPAVPTAPPRAGPMPGRPPARLPAPKAAVLQCPHPPALPQSCCEDEPAKNGAGPLRAHHLPGTA